MGFFNYNIKLTVKEVYVIHMEQSIFPGKILKTTFLINTTNISIFKKTEAKIISLNM